MFKIIKEQSRRCLWVSLLWLSVSSLLSGLLFTPAIRKMVAVVPAALTNLDFIIQDKFVIAQPGPEPVDSLIFLGIDQTSLTVKDAYPEFVEQSIALKAMTQKYPWPRRVYAEAIKKLADAGAEVIVLDLVFPQEGGDDDALRTAIEQHVDKIVLGGVLEEKGQFQPGIGSQIGFVYPAESILPLNSPAEKDVGFVNFYPHHDTRVRRITFQSRPRDFTGGYVHPDEELFPSLAAVTLRKMGHPYPETSIPFEMRWVKNIDQAYHAYSLADIFVEPYWKANFKNGEFFKGKTVLIGPKAPQFQDTHPTPVGIVGGPLLHFNAITNVIRGTLYRRASGNLNAVLVFLVGMLAALSVGLIRKPQWVILALVGVACIFLVFAWYDFEKGNRLLSFVGPLGSLTMTGLIALAFDYSKVYRERQRLRNALERRVSTEVMEEIIDNPESYLNQLGGVRRNITVLFSDLRGFTKMSETREPEELVDHLNEYFNVMVPAIQHQRGMVDKFIGDAIMAVWGSVPEMEAEDNCEQATLAAVEMQRTLAELNSKWKEKGFPELAQGIGLHYGEALTGNIGSENHLELTAMGDTVNLASRLESLTKQYGASVIVSSAVTKHLSEGWLLRPLDCVRVVGRNQAVDLLEVVATPGATISTKEAEWVANFKKAYSLYKESKFSSAIPLFEELKKSRPEDIAVNKLLKRCRDFEATPPDKDWDGSVALDSK